MTTSFEIDYSRLVIGKGVEITSPLEVEFPVAFQSKPGEGAGPVS